LNEYLYAYPEGRRQLWFERSLESKRINFGKNLTGENRAIENLTRPNSLFLSAAAQNNHEKLLPIFKWFSNELNFRGNASGQRFNQQFFELCANNEEAQRTVVKFLAEADLGIVGIKITEEQLNDEMQAFREKFRKLLSEFSNAPAEPPAFGKPMRKITLQHRGANSSAVGIPMEHESAGTLEYIGVIGLAIEAISSGGVLCVDELDASLHPLLVEEIVRLFNQNETNPRGAQLVFTTHTTELLGTGILRRDQIWFTEKDDSGATRIYPMSDFKPRKNENIQRGYLQGRYGATPFIRASALTDICQ